jgi:1-aminocyclopropane-1-carboxylate deaminase/D-cysteine desulfhydrase-like pyridoxal-dependent ACC family enzyme
MGRNVKYRTASIQKVLRKYPNAGLSINPSPIHKLSRLSAHVGHHTYIMRDDLTGFAIGGNKVRKLDYLIGDAVAVGADTLITTKASSFSRNAAAAGKVFGFEVHVMLVGSESDQNSASQALFNQFDTVLHYVPQLGEDALAAEYERVVADLKKQGRATYELHPGGSDSIGALGYINAFDQIIHYSQSSGVHFNTIIHSTGSTATQAGLVLGQCISGYDTSVIGMAASQKEDIQVERIRGLAATTARMLDIHFDESLVVVDDSFIGPGYAIQSEAGNDAAGLFAATEGILLDDVYTAKAAAGLIHYATSGKCGAQDNILFIHTGGNTGLYY